MKKIFTSLVLCLMLSSQTMAAEFFVLNKIELEQNEVKYTAPITISANQDGEINSQDGIRLFLDPDAFSPYVLWHLDNDEYPIQLSGTAVENGKISPQPEVIYSNDYLNVSLPVLEDFSNGEYIQIKLALRSYENDFGHGTIALSLDGDIIPENSNSQLYEIADDKKLDFIPPYPISEIEYEWLEDKLILDWKESPDPDYSVSQIERTITKNGQVIEDEFIGSTFFPQYIDEDLKDVSLVVYAITGVDDKGNLSEPVKITINLSELKTGEPFDSQKIQKPRLMNVALYSLDNYSPPRKHKLMKR